MNESTSNTEKTLVELIDFVRSRFFGKYRGLVSDVNDRENLCRITVKLPEVYGDDDSPWALPSLPFAGKGHGLVMLPEVGDGVWVEFEAGIPEKPIWSGFWFAQGEMPEPAGEESIRAFVTSKNHKIIIDDKANELKLVHGKGAEIALTNDDITIKIGRSQIKLSSKGVDINNGALVVNP